MMIKGLLRAFSVLVLALDRVKLGKETIKLKSLAEKLVLHIRSSTPTYQLSVLLLLKMCFGLLTCDPQLMRICVLGMGKSHSDSSNLISFSAFL